MPLPPNWQNGGTFPPQWPATQKPLPGPVGGTAGMDTVFGNAIQQGEAWRNSALDSILKQLNMPGYASLVESPFVQKAAKEYKTGQVAMGANLGGRGLYESGARDVAQRGLGNIYAGNVASAVASGQQAETQRQQSLLGLLQQIAGMDIQGANQMGAGLRGEYLAGANRKNQELSLLTGRIGGGIGLGAMALGGLLGGAGVLTGVSGAGSALAGAAAGQGLVNGNMQPVTSLFGGQQQQQQQPQSGGFGQLDRTAMQSYGVLQPGANTNPFMMNIFQQGLVK